MGVRRLDVPADADLAPGERWVEPDGEQLLVERLDAGGLLEDTIRGERDELVADRICLAGEDDRDQFDGRVDGGAVGRVRRLEAGVSAGRAATGHRKGQRGEERDDHGDAATDRRTRKVEAGCAR